MPNHRWQSFAKLSQKCTNHRYFGVSKPLRTFHFEEAPIIGCCFKLFILFSSPFLNYSKAFKMISYILWTFTRIHYILGTALIILNGAQNTMQ